jgi:hypothetical protein
VSPQAANDAAPKLTPTRGEIRSTLTGRFSAQFGWFVEPRTVPIGIESLEQKALALSMRDRSGILTRSDHRDTKAMRRLVWAR